MTPHAALQCGVLLLATVTLAPPVGAYMARVYEGRARIAGRILGPMERAIYTIVGVDPAIDMSWTSYVDALLIFNLLGAVAVYLLLRLQAILPLNPRGLGPMAPEIAFNTAASYASNTNWQAYSGERLSLLSQMAALTVQNFLSAATGMAVLVALIRGLARKESGRIGNYWVDLVRSVLYILLPLSILLAIPLVSQGVIQTFSASVTVPLLQPATRSGDEMSLREIALGPVASQEAIKQLGTNGGGFFNANSSHPFENPTPASNFLEMIAILLLPGSLCFTFGKMVGDQRQGRALFAAMLLIFVPFLVTCVTCEESGNPNLTAAGADQRPGADQGGGNMEGKEVRFGAAASAEWAVATTAASNGSVDSMHDSLTPIGGMAALWMIQLGEIVFGGVGSGLYGLIVFALVAVFLSGLMVGRTPEYLGKKIEAFEVKMASLAILVPAACVLVGAAIASVVPAGRDALSNPGPHGFSEILYAFSSASNNNGSAFAGLDASGRFYAVATAIGMLLGRYWVMVPVLALAGSLSAKKSIPTTPGTLVTHTPLFIGMLVATILLVGALTFIPALALGPIVEQLEIIHG